MSNDNSEFAEALSHALAGAVNHLFCTAPRRVAFLRNMRTIQDASTEAELERQAAERRRRLGVAE